MTGWALVVILSGLVIGSLACLIALRGQPDDIVRNRVDSLKT